MPLGRLVVGGACPAPAGPRVLARNQPAAVRTKAISWGPPPVLPSVKGVPFADGRTGGSSQWGGWDGRVTGLPQRRPFAGTPAPRVRAPWSQRAAYSGMQVACGGSGSVRHSPGDRGRLGPREPPGIARVLAIDAPVAFLGTLHPWENRPLSFVLSVTPSSHCLFRKCSGLHFTYKELFPL